MKRLFPAPILSVALFVLWLVLNSSVAPGQLLLALLVSVAAPILTVSLRPLPVRIRHPMSILRLFGHAVADVFSSNMHVLLGVLNSNRAMPRGDYVVVPLELHDPNGLAALAVIMCVTPGTIWTELSLDRSLLLVHVFNLDDEARFIERFKARYEAPLIRIFQS